MKASPACYDLIRESEGLRLEAYLDPVGIPTIGYGSTADVKMGMTITKADAERRLEESVHDCERALRALVHVPLTQGQGDALIDFIYNLGSGRLARSTLLKKLNAGDLTGAADEFGKWVYAGNQKLPGLVTRREKERQLFVSET